MRNLADFLGHWRGNKVLMTVFPHPDDETMASGGFLVIAKQLGWETIAVVLTGGEAGRLHINANGRTVKEIRQEELKKAAKILKIRRLIQADFGDGRLRGKEKKLEKYIKEQIEKFRPTLVVTFDHSGITGHPDHITTSLAVKKILAKTARPPLLLWVTSPRKLVGLKLPANVLPCLSRPTAVLDLGWHWLTKYRAVRAHKSQRFGQTIKMPLALWLLINRQEWYHKINLKKNYPYRYFDFKI